MPRVDFKRLDFPVLITRGSADSSAKVQFGRSATPLFVALPRDQEPLWPVSMFRSELADWRETVMNRLSPGDSQPADDIPRIVRMIKGGVFDPAAFVSHRVKLSGINDAIAKMRSGEVIHAMIHFDGAN